MAAKWSSAAFTAADVADINDTTSSFMGIGATATSNFKMTAGKVATYLRQVGFAFAVAVASPAAVAWGFNSGSGVDNAAGSFTWTAPLSTGAATPASWILKVGVVGSTGSTLQTATTALTVSSIGANPVSTFAGTVGIGTAGSAGTGLAIGGTIAGAPNGIGIGLNATITSAQNNATTRGIDVGMTFNPGAFTGTQASGIRMAAWSTAAFISPGDPAQIRILALTGTGATNAYGIVITPPTGASNNYLIACNTAPTFNVKAAGDITTATTLTVGGVAALNGGITSSIAAGGQVVNFSGAALNRMNFTIQNTSGNVELGVESSTGGRMSVANAYSSYLTSAAAATDLVLGANFVTKLAIGATSGVVTVDSGTGTASVLTIAGSAYGAGVASIRLNGLTSAAGANVGTLTNSPHTGNPAFWAPINIAGTVYCFPCFALT